MYALQIIVGLTVHSGTALVKSSIFVTRMRTATTNVQHG
ncbi:hypothetical protein SPONN_1002 [uncultured Candidatus Thioglobus sp.]|nr:hypothetical protein SPONL_2131 [uncultured Candidatus Thioglobus sp.]SMN02461.1 hypothetical protein SPONN_1002 [uncultured Candidatus Thioglobus sp.]